MSKKRTLNLSINIIVVEYLTHCSCQYANHGLKISCYSSKSPKNYCNKIEKTCPSDPIPFLR